jgi:hypothetical protein
MPTLPRPETADAAAAAFFAAASAAFAAARNRHATEALWLRIAGHGVCLLFSGRRIAEAIAPAFAHLQCAPLQAADLTIALWDSVSTGVALPTTWTALAGCGPCAAPASPLCMNPRPGSSGRSIGRPARRWPG